MMFQVSRYPTYLVAALFTAFVLLPASAQDSEEAPCLLTQPRLEASEPTTRLSEGARRLYFDWVYRLVRDNYVHEDYGGFGWEALREELEPRVLEAETDQEVYALLSEMVKRLGDERSYFMSPNEALAEEVEARQGYVGVGLDFQFSPDNDMLYVLQAFPGGPAEAAGIGRRDRILAVDGDTCYSLSDIRGPEGSRVTLTVQSPGEAPRDLVLERQPVIPTPTPHIRRLERAPDIAYVWIPAFTDEMPVRILRLLGELLDGGSVAGIILDLRGSRAGNVRTLSDAAGLFGLTDFGRFRSRMMTRRVDEPRPWAGPHAERLKELPLVVLADHTSDPGVEMLVATLQFQGRAQVVGSQTAGDMLVVQYHELRGARLAIAESEFLLPDGTSLAGVGVTPDIEVGVLWVDYREEDDPVILWGLEGLWAATAQRKPFRGYSYD